jgi:GTP cyclohydrolase I
MGVNRPAAERAIADFLRALGHDPDHEDELRQTPARVTEAFATELLSGYQVDLAQLILGGSCESDGQPPDGIVAVQDITVAAVCPHHLTPSLGKASVAYLPGTHLLGLGTLARLVDACARRLVLQEQIGRSVVDALMRHAGARGAYCRLSLVHGCLCARGARQPGTVVHTTASAGELSGPRAAAELGLVLGRDE